MLSRETLKAAGAVSVSVIDIFGRVRHGYWLSETCYENEALTEWGINTYICSTFERVVLDGGLLYHEQLVESGFFD